jgi:hypothetical protein
MTFINTDMIAHKPYASDGEMWEVFPSSELKEELRNKNIEFKSHGGNIVMDILHTESISFY